MMMSYDSDPKEYARLAGFGYRMLAEAIKADLAYHISCPALLICGEKDKADKHQLISEEESLKRKPFKRFQKEHCNDMWQTDFKGEFLLRLFIFYL